MYIIYIFCVYDFYITIYVYIYISYQCCTKVFVAKQIYLSIIYYLQIQIETSQNNTKYLYMYVHNETAQKWTQTITCGT